MRKCVSSSFFLVVTTQIIKIGCIYEETFFLSLVHLFPLTIFVECTQLLYGIIGQ